MNRSLITLLLTLLFSVSITGCSLFSSEEDSETATVAEEEVFETDEAMAMEDDLSDEEGMERDEEVLESGDISDEGDLSDTDEMVAEAASMVEEADEGFDGDFDDELSFDDESSFDDTKDELAGDEYSDDDYGNQASNQPTDGTNVDDMSEFGVEDGFPTDTMGGNQDADLFGGDQEEPLITAESTEPSFSMDAPAMAPKFVPVKKMKAQPFQRAGANLNRLYVVRQGESMDAVAQKLYGNPAESETLYSFNPHFRGKSIKVGDKIYYQSPRRRDDQRMMTYYEDVGMNPQYYTSQPGDNIRKVAKQLLGHDRSWMELYATNEMVDSKNAIPAGLQIRYWPEGGSAPIMAMNNTPPPMEEPPAMEDPDPMMQDDGMALSEPEPMPVPDTMAMDDSEAFPEEDPNNMGEEDFDQQPQAPPTTAQVSPPPPPKPLSPPPPPPPPRAAAQPPAAKPSFAKNNVPSDPLAVMGDDSTMMGALGGLLILAAIIVLIFIRRNRAKRVNFSQTQV